VGGPWGWSRNPGKKEALAHCGLARPPPPKKKTNTNSVYVGVLSKPVPENMVAYVELGKD